MFRRREITFSQAVRSMIGVWQQVDPLEHSSELDVCLDREIRHVVEAVNRAICPIIMSCQGHGEHRRGLAMPPYISVPGSHWEQMREWLIEHGVRFNQDALEQSAGLRTPDGLDLVAHKSSYHVGRGAWAPQVILRFHSRTPVEVFAPLVKS